MELQGRDLKFGMQGEDVGLLQRELGQLDLGTPQIPQGEIQGQQFDDGTDLAVRTFQERYGLPVTGVVDEATARRINAEVDRLQEGKFIVRGHIRYPDRPHVGLVKVYDKDMRTEEELGQTSTNDEGYYELTYTADKFSRAEKGSADLRVCACNEGGLELASSRVFYNVDPDVTIDVVVGGETYHGPSEYDRYVAELTPLMQGIPFEDLKEVEGTDSTQPGAEKIQDFTFLSRETGIDGQHIVWLSLAHRLAQGTELAPEVLYGLLRKHLHPQQVHSARVLRDGLEAAIKDNIIAERFQRQISLLIVALQRFSANAVLEPREVPASFSIGDLQETTSLLRPELEKFVQAHANHDGPVEEFWQTLRSDIGPKVDDLQYTLQLGFLTQNTQLVKALKSSGEPGQRTISLHRLAKDLDFDRLKEMIENLAEGEQDGIPSHVPGDTIDKRRENYHTAIVEMLKAAFPTTFVRRGLAIQPTINLPLVKQVRDRYPTLDLTEPLPKTFEVNEEEKIALALFRQEAKMFPNFDYQQTLTEPDGTTGFANRIRNHVAQVLARAEDGEDSDFDLGTTHLDTFFSEHPEVLDGIPDDDQPVIFNQLNSMQRVYRVTARYEHMEALMGEGLHSAFDIATVPPKLFLSVMGPKLGESETFSIKGKADNNTAAMTTLRFSLLDNLLGITPAAVGSRKDVKDMVEKNPTWAKLFGRVDFCACAHCKSVYSPAAYFVDLLEFLNPKTWYPELGHQPPFKVLTKRRPDLPHLKLTCENTNKTLPYVDLVNEILESYIVLGMPLVNNTSSESTSEELSINREYEKPAEIDPSPNDPLQPYTVDISTQAYTTLQGAVFPFSLPFHRPLAVTRTYLDHLGISRSQIMEAFQKPAGPTDLGIAVEFLGLSSKEHELLIGAEGSELHVLYGYDNELEGGEPWQDHIAPVVELIRRAGIRYLDLLELLKSRFINADHHITIGMIPSETEGEPEGQRPDPCDLSLLRIDNLDTDALDLDRMYRFIRLWRKLGWTIQELDQAAVALGATEINDLFLQKLAALRQLQGELKVKLIPLLSLWENIQTHGNDSLYTTLFLNKTVLNPVDETFAEILEIPDAQPVPPHLSSHVPGIVAGLRISASDLALIRKALNLEDNLEGPQPSYTELTLENLSALYRVAFLARSLKLSVTDFLALRVLSSYNPFEPNDPRPALTFAAQAQKIRKSDFSIAQLTYLFRHLSQPGRSFVPDREQMLLNLQQLQTRLRQVMEETTVPEDLSSELVQSKLLLVIDNSVVGTAMAIIDGSSSFNSTDQGAFIDVHFAPFLDPDEAKPILLAPLSADDKIKTQQQEDRLRYVQIHLLTHLRDVLTQELVIQSFSEWLSLDVALTKLLLEEILLVQVDGDQPIIQDFLALVGDGLSAIYFDNIDFTGNSVPSINSTEPLIDSKVEFNWEDGSPHPTITEEFSVRWTGKIQPQFDELYTIYARTSGGVRLWVGDEVIVGNEPAPIIDQWNNQSLAEESGTIALKAGELYDIQMESYSTGAESVAELRWSSLSTPKAIISQEYLYSGNGFISFDKLIPSYVLLDKVAQFVNLLEMTPKEVSYISKNSADFANFDLNTLPLVETDSNAVALFNQWERLLAVVGLRKRLRGRDVDITDAFETAVTSDDPNTLSEDVPNTIMEATGWDGTELSSLAGASGFNLMDQDFRNEEWLLRIESCLKLSKRLGVSTEKLFLSVEGEPDPSEADDFVKAVKAKYGEEQWLRIAKPLNDHLREQQKSALIDYVLVDPTIMSQGITTSDHLFEHFLIDVDMNPCMMTSRIKQALSSIQLFVQRCFMNLENNGPENPLTVSPEALDDERWKWMKNYRVWEANRKVFLYPENWIEPELRDDKTPFFKDLENELLQDEVTTDTVERVFRNYLGKLDEVARLDLVGMYWQKKDKNETTDIIHVFGRTFNIPHIYYYRHLMVATNAWSPWERLELDIGGDNEGGGVHLIPVVHFGRLLLFWPIFAKKLDPQVQPQPETGPQIERWEIKMAYSEYKQGHWGPMKTSSGFVPVPSIIEGERWKETKKVSEIDEMETVEGIISDGIDTSNAITVDVMMETGKILDTRVGYLPARGDITFNKYFDGDRLGIKVVGMDTSEGVEGVGRTHGYFYMEACNNQLRVWWDRGPDIYFADSGIHRASYWSPSGSNNFYMAFDQIDNFGGSFYLDRYQKNSQLVLNKTQQPYHMLYPHNHQPLGEHFHLGDSVYPFFYQDAFRSYAVVPTFELLSLSLHFGNWIPYDYIFQPPKLEGADFQNFNDRFSQKVQGVGLTGRSLAGAASSMLPFSTQKDVMLAQGQSPKVVEKFPYGGGYLSEYTWKSVVSGVTYLKFMTFFHPSACSWIKALNQQGIQGLLPLNTGQKGKFIFSGELIKTLFEELYDPNSEVVHWDYPKEDVDFDHDGAYSQYNWELFFHIPMVIATRLSQDQRFEEAQQWYHYIFNPSSSSGGSSLQRYWKFLPFFRNTNPKDQQIKRLLEALSYSGPNKEKRKAKKDVEEQVNQWGENPFNPHLIARMRITAYQKNVVMKYIDNLIAWGDQLFRRDTIESLNEATQLYVMAANLLGERPENIPASGSVEPETYDSLKKKKLDDFGNTLVSMETEFPLSLETSSGNGGQQGEEALHLESTFYFCIPKNDKLLKYWDTVADRLFKIRNCMNIEGIVRELPLFQPPIDPALLVRAFAKGIDISSVLNDLHAPLPHYRFTYLLPKALELCAEVKTLGNLILSVLEKKDAEGLAVLRATHETSLLKAVREIKKQQLAEAGEIISGLVKTKATVTVREGFYKQHLTDEKKKDLPQEKEQQKQLGNAQEDQETAANWELTASIMQLIPNFSTGSSSTGPTFSVSFGGSNLGTSFNAVASRFRFNASTHGFKANKASIEGSKIRRIDEWQMQFDLAQAELQQIDKQIDTAVIRESIAQTELDNHETQIEQAREVEDFLRRKFTDQELYSWMLGQISAVFYQSYKLAYDMAKRVERTYRFELGLSDSNFIQFGYWDSQRKGLLAGERLHHDLKRMETAYLEKNKREYEITKQISLRSLDPLQLISLTETGTCEVVLDEILFDIDYPGHYMRRIKNVSLTIPCVIGSYTSVNCTLTLLKHQTRVDRMAQGPYGEDIEQDDPRFVTQFGAVQSIATSHGQNDNGMFELNFRDERYLPFEGAGVISRWRLELPSEFRQFDYDTISDVIFHVRYTAREGGQLLKEAATNSLLAAVASFEDRPLLHMFSMKHELPTEWHGFLHPSGTNVLHAMSFPVGPQRFPFFVQRKTITVQQVALFVHLKPGINPIDGDELAVDLTPYNGAVSSLTFSPDPTLEGLLVSQATGLTVPVEEGASWNLEVTSIPTGLQEEGSPLLDPEKVKDLGIVFHYTVS